ncbi:MAG TPA: molecular chaperone TorD family protein [Thermoanaerobaculia bacterium]|nr:molecular chaperone TorD family protein [Thermoanaerobaculia bacterium]
MTVTAPVGLGRDALRSIAPLFAWPGDDYQQHLERAHQTIARADRRAAKSFEAFAHGIGALGPSAREMTYTSTFDLAPSCSPYLGIQVFGDNGRERSRLMVGLRASYSAAGHDLRGELPDHLALVLAYGPDFEAEEWSDLLHLILEPALDRMERLFSGTSNPYRHLISVALRLTRAAVDEERNA